MKNIVTEVGKGCFVVSFFNGDEYVDCGQFHQSGDAGAYAAKLVGTTPHGKRGLKERGRRNNPAV